MQGTYIFKEHEQPFAGLITQTDELGFRGNMVDFDGGLSILQGRLALEDEGVRLIFTKAYATSMLALVHYNMLNPVPTTPDELDFEGDYEGGFNFGDQRTIDVRTEFGEGGKRVVVTENLETSGLAKLTLTAIPVRAMIEDWQRMEPSIP